MTSERRTTLIKIGAAVCGVLFVLNYLVIGPYTAAWSGQSDHIDKLRQDVARGQQLVDRQNNIRNRWSAMLRANLPTDISASENIAVQAIDRWARTSGIAFSSLSPSWQEHDDDGYQLFELRATATGTQAALARFIYELETDPSPVNLEEYELTSRDDRGASLTMTARFSFIHIDATEKGGG
jgi:Tfp pilus assembly protein PilO